MMLCLCTIPFRDPLAWVATNPGFMRTVCRSSLRSISFILANLLVPACNTDITVEMAFGGQSWPINPEDFIIRQISNGSNPLCMGAIAVFGSNGATDSNSPAWVVGVAFLVRNLSRL